MAANTIDLAKLVHERIAPKIAEYGLELPAFYVENISLPEEVEKVLDKRTSTSIAGDLSKYTEFSAAEAMTKSAENPGGAAAWPRAWAWAWAWRWPTAWPAPGRGARARRAGAAARLGRGPDAASAAGRASAGTWRRTGRRPGPSPATSSAGWPRRGTIGPDTWLWTPGGPDWVRGRDVSELADLFSAPPPPPPAG